MKTKTALFCLIALLLAGCRTPEPGPQLRTDPPEQRLTPETAAMENGLLRLEFIPGSMGRLSSIRWKDGGQELLSAYEEREKVYSPLYIRRSNNAAGLRELFWGTPSIYLSQPMELQKQTPELMRFYSPYYGNTQLALRRQVRLQPDTTVLEFSSEFKTTGETEQKYAIWLNLCPAQPMVPQIVLKNTPEHREQVAAGWKHQEIFPMVSPWIGGYLPDSDSMLVFSIPREEFLPDGFFYSWYCFVPGKNIHTMEPVFARRTLRPGETRIHRWRLLVFRGIRHLKALHGTLAFDAVRTAGGMKLIVASAAPFSGSRKAALVVQRTDAPSLILKAPLPPCSAGQAVSVELKLPAGIPDGTPLSLQLENELIQLIGGL